MSEIAEFISQAAQHQAAATYVFVSAYILAAIVVIVADQFYFKEKSNERI